MKISIPMFFSSITKMRVIAWLVLMPLKQSKYLRIQPNIFIKLWVYVVMLLSALLPVAGQAAVSFTGATYTQNFDSLISSGTNQTWTNDNTLSGWFLLNKDNTAITTYDAGTGSSTTGKFYSFGASSASDRALGGLGSGGTYFGSPGTGTVAGWIAFAATNNSGATINSVAISFNGEQWRDGGNTTAQTMVLEYGLGASFTAVASWTAPGSTFNWTSPVATSTGAAVDGNVAGLVSGKGGTLSSLSWANGDTLWIRWIENNDSGNDHGLAIDNFSLSVPTSTPTVNLSYSPTSLSETRTLDGVIADKITITLSGDTFTGSNGDEFVTASKVAVSNVPAGLTATVTRTSATTAELSFTGTASSHANSNDVNTLTLVFANSAFTSGNASAVLNSTKNDLNLDFGDAGAAGSTQTFTPNTGTTLDNSDASTALALDANWMVVADDEASVLRVYPRAGGAAVMEWSFATGLGTGTNEIDLEASTRIGNSLYFIGSHSNKKDGTAQSSREHLFEVTVAGTGANTQFTYVGKQTGLETALKTWDSGNTHGKGTDYFGFTASAAGGVIPENVNGFSIEGMTATQDGTQLLLAFRAPMANTSVRDKAVIVPVSVTGLIGGSPTFGTPFELNLGGRGVRSIEKAVTGSDYLILAGPSVSATTEVTHDFRLYRWDGSSNPPTELNVDLDTLLASTGGSFETLVDVLSTTQGTLIQLLQDNGDTIWSGQTQASKDLAAAAQKFQGNWVSLGANVVTDTTAPTLVSSSPVNSATNATVNTDMVLKFNEAVKAGTGNFVIKKVSDNSTVETLALGSANVSIAYNTVTLNPTTTLDYNTAYYVEASNTVITDTANNGWVGLSGASAYTFTTVPPQTVLDAGDVLFLGANADTPDAFAFVLLKAVVTGTQIGFTDRNYNNSTGMPASGESAYLWTANQNYAAGTIVTIQPDVASGNPIADKGTTQGAGGGLSTSAETIYAFQGSIAGLADGTADAITVDRFLASINFGGAAAGDIPTTLTTAGANISFSTDNAIYSGSLNRTDLTAFAALVKDTANYTTSESTPTALINNSLFGTTYIHAIQGTGTTAALTGVQTIEGIVTKKFSGLTGFFVQEENTDADADPATSEGIFIHDTGNLFTGNAGDKVRLTGTAKDYTASGFTSSITEMDTLTNVTVINTGNTLPTAATVQIPVTNVSDLERFEGMLVNVSSTSGNLVVTETYRLGQYGQVTLADSRLEQFTHASVPSTSGYSAHLANIAKRIIYLDDGSSTQNPDPEIFARGGNPLSASNTLRSGDTVSSVIGVLDHRYEGYRVQTTSGVNFTAANTRPASAPSVGAANVKVASFNLLNYFNTFDGLPDTVDNCNNGVGGTAADCRGADDVTEFTRQKDKHKQVVIGLNADVIGLMELENDGYGGTSAQQDLLNLINGAGLSGRNYKMVDADTLIGSTNALGTDAIKIGLIYDDNAVELVAGSVKTSNNAIFDRRPLAATFKHKTSNEKFTVVVNHLKSKGSAGSLSGDTDQNDGQGNSNATRVAQAQALVTFLATLTDDPDILVMGDMNAYAQEAPMTTIKNAGYTDLLGTSKYSYVFDGQIGYLDHALASSSLVPQVTGADDWHINSDEPSVLDYNTEFKSAGQITSFYAATPFRSSDHDPVLIGLNLGKYTSTTSPNSPSYTVIVQTAGNGTGQVEQTAIPTTGSAKLQLKAVADANSRFVGWSERFAPECVGSNPIVTVTVNAIKTCIATFEKIPPRTQTINFAPLPAKQLGDPDFSLVATATSGLMVTFNSTTPTICSVNQNTTVHLNNSGTCHITAQQLGNNQYLAAIPVSQSFNIAPRTNPTTGTGNSSTGGNTSSGTGSVIPSQLRGISANGYVDQQPLIVGLFSSGKQRVLIRASGVFQDIDPKISVFTYPDRKLLASNDNWNTATSAAELQQKQLTPSRQTDAGMIVELPGGLLTVEMTAKVAGVGLVEVYDLGVFDRSSTSYAFKGFSVNAELNDYPIIAGLLVVGDKKRMLLRASGLTAGVDPELEVFSYPDRRLLAANHRWATSTAQLELQQKQLVPPREMDAATVTELSQGLLTVEVTKARNTQSGRSIVEIYEMTAFQ